MQKVDINRAGPRGCDVARKATWTRAMACVAGGGDMLTEHVYIFIYYIKYMGPPCIMGQSVNWPYSLPFIY